MGSATPRSASTVPATDAARVGGDHDDSQRSSDALGLGRAPIADLAAQSRIANSEERAAQGRSATTAEEEEEDEDARIAAMLADEQHRLQHELDQQLDAQAHPAHARHATQLSQSAHSPHATRLPHLPHTQQHTAPQVDEASTDDGGHSGTGDDHSEDGSQGSRDAQAHLQPEPRALRTFSSPASAAEAALKTRASSRAAAGALAAGRGRAVAEMAQLAARGSLSPPNRPSTAPQHVSQSRSTPSSPLVGRRRLTSSSTYSSHGSGGGRLTADSAHHAAAADVRRNYSAHSRLGGIVGADRSSLHRTLAEHIDHGSRDRTRAGDDARSVASTRALLASSSPDLVGHVGVGNGVAGEKTKGRGQ